MRLPVLPSVVGTAIVFYHLLIARRVARRERKHIAISIARE